MMDKNKAIFQRMHTEGFTYKQYIELAERQIELSNRSILSEDEKNRIEEIKLNLHRMKRIDKHASLSEKLTEFVMQVSSSQIWMIISETWCGDSAQNIPYIVKAANLNPLIKLRILLRDDNTDIMNLYLTNNTRSIPILAAFNTEGNELFKWGPRPKEAQQLIEILKNQGAEKKERLEKLHLWYGRNKGAALESEFINILENHLFIDQNL